jgi:hypothetical protein
MDYGKVLSRAWEITWRWKALWILGFLAALGQGGGGGGGGGNVSYSFDGSEWQGWTMHEPPWEIVAPILSIVVALVCLAILIGIALWVISVMARGGLIAGVQQVEDEGSTSFLQAWRVGRSRFWTLFGLDILATVPFLILLLLGIAAMAALIIGGEAAFDEAGAIVPGILCGLPLCCGSILLAIVLNQIKLYGDRAAILEGLGWIDAFKRGWEVLKANLGPTIVFWLIFLVIGLLIVIVVGGAIFATVVPFAAIVAGTHPGAWIVAPICFGGLLSIIVFALINSIVTTFTSATWTLAYREMTGLAATPPAEVPTE